MWQRIADTKVAGLTGDPQITGPGGVKSTQPSNQGQPVAGSPQAVVATPRPAASSPTQRSSSSSHAKASMPKPGAPDAFKIANAGRAPDGKTHDMPEILPPLPTSVLTHPISVSRGIAKDTAHALWEPETVLVSPEHLGRAHQTLMQGPNT